MSGEPRRTAAQVLAVGFAELGELRTEVERLRAALAERDRENAALRAQIESARNTCSRAGGCLP